MANQYLTSEHLLSFFPETTVCAPPADWAANGTPVEFVSINLDGVQEEQIVDPTAESRHLAVGNRQRIRGRRNGTHSVVMKMHGTGAVTADAATVTQTALGTLWTHCLGAVHLGTSHVITGGTATQPILDSVTGIVPGCMLAFSDTNSPTAENTGFPACRRVLSISTLTKRAAAQLERMAKDAERTSGDLHKLALQSKAPATGFDMMGMASGKLMSVLGPAALGGTLMALGSWLGEASEKTLQYETALANLPFALEGAQAATRGLMSESKLAAAASSALALGVVKTDAEFSQLASDAAKIALKLGVSTDQMIGDLTTALGRGSAMILDNAGIILKVSDANEAYAASIGKTVSQLDEAEKKIAFQTAAMAAIRASADATTVAYESNAASIARLKVSAGDAWEAIERASVNAVGAVTSTAMTFNDDLAAMSASVDLLNRSMMQREEWSQGFKDLSVSAGETAIELLGMSEVAANFQRVLSDPESYKRQGARSCAGGSRLHGS